MCILKNRMVYSNIKIQVQVRCNIHSQKHGNTIMGDSINATLLFNRFSLLKCSVNHIEQADNLVFHKHRAFSFVSGLVFKSIEVKMSILKCI